MTSTTRRALAGAAVGALFVGVAILAPRAADTLPGAQRAEAMQKARATAIAPEPIAEDGSGAVTVSIGTSVYRVTFCLPIIPAADGSAREVEAPCAMGDGPLVTLRPLPAR